MIERAFLDDALVAGALHEADAIAADAERVEHETGDPGAALARLVRAFGDAKLLRHAVPTGGEKLSARALCLVRERLGRASPLADLAFAMQGLGSHPIVLASNAAAHAGMLGAIARGEVVAAFALTEREAGSDVGAIATTARRDGGAYVIDGEKVLISNAAIAGVYTLFAATAPPGEKRRLSAFVVPADTPGLVAEPMRVLGGHPIGRVVMRGVRVPEGARLGAEGDGMSLALGTLHRFRPTVGAAAVGFAQRALDETVRHVRARRQFGAPLADLQAVQMKVAEMACMVEASRLLVYRAAAAIDAGADRSEIARTGSMAKLVATESAQSVIDHAVQLHGGAGVLEGSVVARLYQDVRALRIYEGASDVQKLLIAREVLGGT